MISWPLRRINGPEHNRHVVYTRYLERIIERNSGTHTAEEVNHATLVAGWLDGVGAGCWAVEPSLKARAASA